MQMRASLAALDLKVSQEWIVDPNAGTHGVADGQGFPEHSLGTRRPVCVNRLLQESIIVFSNTQSAY